MKTKVLIYCLLFFAALPSLIYSQQITWREVHNIADSDWNYYSTTSISADGTK